MDIGDDGEAQRIRNTAIAPPTTDCEVARNTPSAPPLPLCSQSFSISGERLSIPHQASGKDAVKRITPKTVRSFIQCSS
jgi:hypothetical protein